MHRTWTRLSLYSDIGRGFFIFLETTIFMLYVERESLIDWLSIGLIYVVLNVISRTKWPTSRKQAYFHNFREQNCLFPRLMFLLFWASETSAKMLGYTLKSLLHDTNNFSVKRSKGFSRKIKIRFEEIHEWYFTGIVRNPRSIRWVSTCS